jgi:hypothetical protein
MNAETFTGRQANCARSKIKRIFAMSNSTQSAVSLICASVVPLALMATHRPSADFTEVLPPRACT